MTALKKCKDCGYDVSKKAEVCPNCGARLKRRWYEIGSFTTTLVISTVLLIIIVIIVGSA